jgi:hypothetical protein
LEDFEGMEKELLAQVTVQAVDSKLPEKIKLVVCRTCYSSLQSQCIDPLLISMAISPRVKERFSIAFQRSLIELTVESRRESAIVAILLPKTD